MIKKQHYIPRSYLRNFSQINDLKNDRKNKILVYDKNLNKQYPSTVYDIACENHFYDIDSGTNIQEKQVIETAFSHLEGSFAILLRKLIGCCNTPSNDYSALILKHTERNELSFYIAMQLLRTKKYRDILGTNHSQYIEKILNLYNEACLYNPDMEPISGYTINKKEIHLNYLLNEDLVNSISLFLSNSYWVFLRNETNIPFIISDNPVCRIPRYYTENGSDQIHSFFSDSLEIYYPISQNIALHIFRKDTKSFLHLKKYKNRLIPCNDLLKVELINSFQAIMANEKIFIDPNCHSMLDRYVGMDLSSPKNILL